MDHGFRCNKVKQQGVLRISNDTEWMTVKHEVLYTSSNILCQNLQHVAKCCKPLFHPTIYTIIGRYQSNTWISKRDLKLIKKKKNPGSSDSCPQSAKEFYLVLSQFSMTPTENSPNGASVILESSDSILKKNKGTFQ